MKTKEEVIKEAWGLLWNNFNKTSKECALKNDGYVSTILENNLYQTYTYYNKAKAAWRPVSLEGIENNNGLVSVKSKEDLPKYFIECYFITKYSENTIVGGFFSSSDKKFYNHNHYYNIDEITHYQPIVKPNKPLY